jgi:hypothetical protein
MTRGLWKKPKKPKKKVLLRKGHQIPEQMGMTDEQRQNMQEYVTGKRSMAEMTKDEMIQWVNYLEAELAARGEKYIPKQPILPRLTEQLSRATRKEALASAAIRLKSGEMLTGGTHSNILRDVAASGRTIANEEFDVPAGSGFMTNTGRFVSPEDAWKIGERAGQLNLEGDDRVMAQELIDKKYLVAEGIKYYAPLKSKIANNRIAVYIKDKLRSPHTDLVRIERWLEAIDGFGTGLLHDVIWKRVKRADELRSIMTSQGQMAFLNLLEENNNDGALMSGKKESAGDHQLTPMEKIGVYLLSQNKHGFRYLTKGMAFTEDDLKVVSDSLTEQELAIATWLDEEYRTQWPVLRAAAMDVGIDPELLEQELNYSPIVRIGDESDVDFVSLLTEQFNRQSNKPEDGFLQQRRQRALGKLELDAGVIYMKNVQRIETFKAMAPVARDLGKIFSNPGFKQAFNNATDDNGIKILNTWLRDTVKGSIRGPQTWFEKAIAAMRKNGIIYAIGYNIPSAFRQTLSGFNAMAVDPLMLKYHPDNLAKATFTRDGYKDMRDFVVERSTLVRTRKYDRDLRRKWDASRLAKRVDGKKPWDEKATSWIRWMDEHTVTIAWKSLYDTAMEKTKGDEQASIDFADQAITRTQPMANMKDLPHFFRGGQIARLLSTFQNQINNNYNFYVHDIIGKRAAGKISNTEAGYRVMMSLVLPAIAFGIIGRGGLPTEDGEISLKKLLVDLTTYPIASVMIAGRWINRMIKGWGNSGTVGEIAPEEAARAFQEMMKGNIRGTIQPAAAAYGAATGRIPAQAIRTASGTLDLIAGDTRDPRRLVYTQWALDQGNTGGGRSGGGGRGPAKGPASSGGPAGGPR